MLLDIANISVTPANQTYICPLHSDDNWSVWNAKEIRFMIMNSKIQN